MKNVLHRVARRLPWRASPAASAWDEDVHASLCRTVTAILFLVSGLVQWLILLVPGSGSVNERGLAMVGLGAIVAGAVVTRMPARLFTGLHGFLTVIPVAIALAGFRRYFAGPSTEHYAIFHIVTFVWLGIACRRGAGLATAPFLVASFIVPLVLHGNVTSANIASLISMVPVCVLVSETLAWMVIRLRSAESELQRQEAQAAVDRAETRYLALIEQLPSVTYVLKGNRDDPLNSQVEYISPQLESMLGVSPEQWTSEPGIWNTMIHPDDKERVLAIDLATYLTGEPYEQEYRMIRPDGRIVWVLESARRIDADRPDEVIRLGEYYDTTSLHEAEASLRETDSRYRTLLEQVPLVIYMEEINTGDAVLPCLYVSPQISTLVGFEPAEWREQFRWEQCLHPADKTWVTREWANANATRGAFTADYRLTAKDGRTVWVHDEAQVVYDDAGAPKYWHGFMLDITREKEAEGHLRQSEAEFRLLFYKNPLPAWV
ncbi:MAG: PAS domain-containing protein, partial [Chloroflexota bacterium]|nr:PAS domain-containing protein [Chloroflexota bacterium]